MLNLWLPSFFVFTFLALLINCQNKNNFITNKLEFLTRLLPYSEEPFSQKTLDQNFFDFIVVGSGSSGAVLANRLSEIKSWNILLLEAGNRANLLNQIPVLAPIYQLTPHNWNYTMQRQDGFCLAMDEQICAWPRGKALGGTSTINYMIYTRGNPKDYNKWASLGNEGWSYNEVLSYFLKSEDCSLSEELCSGPHHNKGGYLSVDYPFKSRITDAFIQAGVQLGENIVDYNTPNYMGFSQIQANIKFGRRHSTAEAFLYPILNSRKNLKVITSARVTKILIDPFSKRASGVMFRKRGKNFVVKTNKEVILSAGVFNSPQLLMLSGIGPKEHLKDLGIPLIQDLPVGQVLYDHIAYLGLTFKINQTVEPRDILFNPVEMIKWFLTGKGPYSSLAGVEALAYINTGSIPDSNYPDIELLLSGPGSLEADGGLVVARELRLRRDVYKKYFGPLVQIPTYSIFPMLLHPKSRGYLKLKSKDPYDEPELYGNYFTDSKGQDIATLLAAIRYIQKLSKTRSFQEFGAEEHDIPVPGCENYIFDSDNYWKCALRSLSVTLHHQIGTCKMGPANDPEAVVDPRLKVYGIEGLRVVDSSIIPVTLSAHTNAPSMMIGEKTADIIKQDWKKLP